MERVSKGAISFESLPSRTLRYGLAHLTTQAASEPSKGAPNLMTLITDYLQHSTFRPTRLPRQPLLSSQLFLGPT